MEPPQGEFRHMLASCLASASEVSFALLFGSQAKGTASAGSDVDVAVYLREPYTMEEVKGLWNRIEDLLRREVDLVVLNDAAPGIAWSACQGDLLVRKDGRLFLEKMLEFSREAEDLRQTVFELIALRQRLRRGMKSVTS